jgi:transcriptional regulator of acetoin/glycerol metabolism
MSKSLMYLVSEDQRFIENCRRFAESFGVTVKVFTPTEWQSQSNTPVPALSSGTSPVHPSGSNVIAFPSAQSRDDKKVSTMNELESEAIKNAIFEYKGNLTEAAKALGIGRATLYRKVKQYNIDPSEARRRRYSQAS